MTAFRPGASPPPVEMAIRKTNRSVLFPGFAEQAEPLARLRVPSELPLGKHGLPVDPDLENAAAARYEHDFCLEFPFELRRQTGGAWFVVSDQAILDFDPHDASSRPSENRAE